MAMEGLTVAASHSLGYNHFEAVIERLIKFECVCT